MAAISLMLQCVRFREEDVAAGKLVCKDSKLGILAADSGYTA